MTQLFVAGCRRLLLGVVHWTTWVLFHRYIKHAGTHTLSGWRLQGRFPAEAAPIYTIHEALRVHYPWGGWRDQSIGSTVSDDIVRSFLWSTATEFSHWATSVAQNKILDDNLHLKPTIYYRYIDDILVVTQDMTQLQDLKTVIQNNSVLTFIHEIGQNSNIKPALATISQNLHKINEFWYLF